jgi:hypothetical protein
MSTLKWTSGKEVKTTGGRWNLLSVVPIVMNKSCAEPCVLLQGSGQIDMLRLLRKSKKKTKLCCYRRAGTQGKSTHSSYSFLTSALDGVSGQPHGPAALYPRERTASTHWIGGWVDFRAGLDTKARGKILYLCRGSDPDRPVYSQTLYWLTNLSSYSNYV